ncbi:hypothetical protein ACTNB0_06360, partial [Lachnospiraceae bacterium HCP28S3_F9]
WASSDHQAPEILSIFGPGCIVSDIFEINVSTNIDNITMTKSTSKQTKRKTGYWEMGLFVKGFYVLVNASILRISTIEHSLISK